jgi:O-antigen/teichoic acid export membrane protein
MGPTQSGCSEVTDNTPNDESEPKEGESLAKKTTRSVFWNVVLLPLQYVLPFLSTIIVIPALGTTLYGQLATLTAVATTVSTYTDLGVSKSLPKFVAEVEDRFGQQGWQDFVLSLGVIRILITALFLILINASSNWFISFFKMPTQGDLYVRLVSVWIIFQAISSILSMVLVARFRHREMNLVTVISSVVEPLLVAGTVLLGGGLLGVLAASIFVEALRGGAMLYGLRGELSLRSLRFFPFSRQAPLARRFAVYSAFSYLIVIMQRYFFSLPFMILLMGYFGLQDRIGYLALANKVSSLVVGVTNLPLSYTIAPLLGATFADPDYRRLRKAYLLINRFNQFISAAPSIAVMFVANGLVLLFFGQQYLPAVPSLRLLLGLFAAGGLVAYGSSVLQTYEKYGGVVISSLLGLGAMLLLAVVTPSALRESRVAIAVGGGYCVFQISSMLLGHRAFGLAYPVRHLAKVLAACLPMLLYLAFRQSIGTSLWALLGYVVYSGLAFIGVFRLLGGLEQEEREALHKLDFPLKGVVLRLLT